jgi:hypothetical protein
VIVKVPSPTAFTVPIAIGLTPPSGCRPDADGGPGEPLGDGDDVDAPATAPPLRINPSAIAAALVT